MNWVFLTFVFLAAAAAVWMWRRRPPSNEITRKTSVPGYSITPGSEFVLDSDGPFRRGADWTVQSIEEFHARGRTRLVLTFDVASALSLDDIRELVAELTGKVQARTRASVVFADVVSEGETRAGLLLAPDGAGWGGDGAPREIFSGSSS